LFKCKNYYEKLYDDEDYILLNEISCRDILPKTIIIIYDSCDAKIKIKVKYSAKIIPYNIKLLINENHSIKKEDEKE